MTDLNLPDSTASGRARAEALDLRHRPEVAPTSLVNFLSHGRVLPARRTPDEPSAHEDITRFADPRSTSAGDGGPLRKRSAELALPARFDAAGQE